MHSTNPRDRYEILGPLGCGATSRVDKARDTVLGRTVALKTLVHSFGAAAEQKQFLREAQIVGQLSHPAIVSLYDVGIEQENVAYLVMEYVSGKTLQQVLSEGVVPLPRACAWVIDLAGALSSAHRAGVIHGDVKPANILVNQDGNVKLSDFGIARLATQVSGSGRLMGTPAYLSPEQISGDPQSNRSDLFSLGVVLYQMVTGGLPFQGSSITAVCAQILSVEPVPPSQRNSALPPEIDRVIMRCLAKNPADRYPSAEALAASLYPFGRDTITSVPQPESQPVHKVYWLTQPTRPRDLWAAAAIVLLLACGVSLGRVEAARFCLSPAPLIATVAPKPPADLVGYSQVDPLPADQIETALEPLLTLPAQEVRAPHRSASITRSQPGHARIPAARNVNMGGPVSAPELSSPPIASPTRSVVRAALQIEIDSTVEDGALAIFADQTLVFTTELHARASTQPLRLEQPLPAGPHQLRVALYRPDKSLQVAKEGLGDIRSDTLNTLKIHVARRSKLLVRHETSLDVSWPSAMAPTPRSPGSASLSASAK